MRVNINWWFGACWFGGETGASHLPNKNQGFSQAKPPIPPLPPLPSFPGWVAPGLYEALAGSVALGREGNLATWAGFSVEPLGHFLEVGVSLFEPQGPIFEWFQRGTKRNPFTRRAGKSRGITNSTRLAKWKPRANPTNQV